MKGVATTADIELLEEITLASRDLPSDTYAALQKGASKKPDKIALQFFLQGTNYKDAVFYTYKDLMALVTQTANMFHGLGIGKDDVVSMILPNLPQAFFTIWGGQAAGIVNPIDPSFEAAVMADIMNMVGTKVLVTLAPFPASDIWQKVASIANEVPTLEMILKVDIGYYLGFFQRAGLSFLNLRSDKGPKLQAKVEDFGLAARQYSGEALENGRFIQPDDIAAYFHTNDEMGTPKLVQHTHSNMVFAAWSAATSVGLDHKNIMYAGLPLFRINDVIMSGLIPWMQGASVVLGAPAGFRADGVILNFWDIVEHYGLNVFNATPAVYEALLNVPVGEHDIRSLQFALCGAAPLPVEVLQEFEEQTGVRILEGYGRSAETCLSSINPSGGQRRMGSVGLRLPYQDIRVVVLAANGQYERDCETDEIGVVVVRGPNVFKGYLDAAQNQDAWLRMRSQISFDQETHPQRLDRLPKSKVKNGQALNTDDGGGDWFNTGDLGRQDADGYFWLIDHKKEQITT